MSRTTTEIARKRIIWLAASAALFIPIILGLHFSFRYLPSINKMPPWIGNGREEQNWFGQSMGMVGCYVVILLLVSYCLKRVILVRCKKQWTAGYCYLLLVMLTLPYIWFLCEANWFYTFIYRISCWVGGPIAFWFVPTVSFLLDLASLNTKKSLKFYLVRSAVEIVIIFPLWGIFWAFTSFFVLGWGWI